MSYIILILLKFYKKTLSPILHFASPNSGCRFYPSCSEYVYQAIVKYGFLKGTIKGVKRLFKCHPFNLGGYDPV